jgi:hypothetical protein
MGGASAKDWGELLLTVDDARRSVRLEFPDKNHRGESFDYQDGAFAPIQSGKLPSGVTDTAPVWQFVRITPARVEFGFRSAAGDLQHFAWFDRASLGRHSRTSMREAGTCREVARVVSINDWPQSLSGRL